MRPRNRPSRRPTIEPHDQQALAAIARGELSGFDGFVNRHKQPILGYCRGRLSDGHLAEDLAQEVFLRAFRYVARHGPPQQANVRPWLMTIARNCVMDHLRARQRRPLRLVEAEVLDGIGPDIDPSTEAVRQDERRLLVEAMNRLPQEQQEVVRLRMHAQLSFHEIADTLDTSEATVRSRMRYAIQKLREAVCRQEHAS